MKSRTKKIAQDLVMRDLALSLAKPLSTGPSMLKWGELGHCKWGRQPPFLKWLLSRCSRKQRQRLLILCASPELPTPALLGLRARWPSLTGLFFSHRTSYQRNQLLCSPQRLRGSSKTPRTIENSVPLG